MYELNDVTKRYGNGRGSVEALVGINLSIGDGEFVAIQGPTGQGKSTLLQLLGGMDRQTSGTIAYDGRELGALSESELTRLRAHEFGFVFQTFNLIPTLSSCENVETALVPLGVHGSERRRRAEEALAEVGLGHRAAHLPGELSGGEKQRTAIARALVKGPRVVLARRTHREPRPGDARRDRGSAREAVDDPRGNVDRRDSRRSGGDARTPPDAPGGRSRARGSPDGCMRSPRTPAPRHGGARSSNGDPSGRVNAGRPSSSSNLNPPGACTMR